MAQLQSALGVVVLVAFVDIISLGGKSIVSGTLTPCLMGAIVGVLS